MDIQDNDSRATSARMTLEYFCELVPNDPDTRVLATDLICNIMHLLAREGIDSHEVFEAAEGHFISESQF